jgi:ATP-binding cassette, subfamily B, bacterial
MKLITRQTYAIYWQEISKRKLAAFAILFFVTAATVVETMVPLYYKRFFDILAGATAVTATSAELTKIIFIILFLYLTTQIFWRLAAFTNIRFAAKAMANLMNDCFENLHSHSFRFFTNKFVGSLVRKVGRLVRSFEIISDKVIWDLTPITVRISAILIVLFINNRIVAMIVLGWTLIYLVINYSFSLYKLKYDRAVAAQDTVVTGRLADTITNSTNLKVFSAQKQESAAFEKLTKLQSHLRKKAWDLNEFMDAGQGILMVFLEFAVFFFAIRFWAKGLLTLGDFVLIQIYLVQLFGRLWNFGRVIRDMYEQLANAEEMTEILNTPNEIQDQPGAGKLKITQGLVEYKDISFAYHKTRNIIKNFNLVIKPCEKIGLVGPSGGGKSTMVGLLYRFFEVNKGQILIDQQNINAVTQNSLRRNIGYVPQDPILFHRTLKENIKYGRQSATEKEIADAARLAHCDEFISRLPDKFNTYVGERGIKLSGGERQRVAIARAILKNAPILVLDEATSSLDSHSELLIQDALVKLMENKTTIVIAHRLSTIMKMDRILVVKDGQITETGTHQALLKKKDGLYKKLWRLQAGGFIA